jgi:transcriptional regulator with XRE-family HTH domain
MTAAKQTTANNIRLYREAIGLTQNDLSLRTSIPAPTLRRYEKGEVRISEQNRKAIAEALDKPVEKVFPTQAPTVTMDRRQFFGAAIAGTGLAAVGLNPIMLTNPTFQGTRHEMSKDEISTLAEDNYGLWELLNALQRGASIQFIYSVTQGRLLTLKHLADCSLLPYQRNIMLNFLADAYLILGRITREIQDYGTGYACFQEALRIARETGNTDLKAAAHQRYGYMLLDLERYTAAQQNAEEAMADCKDAAFPIWGEVQLYAAKTYAYLGQIGKAKSIAAKARDMERGRDPEVWFGKLLNPQTSYANFELIADVAAEQNFEAVQAAEATLKYLDREEPDNLQWRTNIQELYATALWQLGNIDEAVAVAKESLLLTRAVGSIVNEARIEKLYHKMRTSPFKKRQSIRELGELVAVK